MKMKPVFSNREDKERDIERDRSLDVTTVSKVEETKETPISNMVNMVTKEEAENIARQYADRASEQAVNTALERYDSRRREDEERRKKEMEAERGAEIEAKRRRRKEDEDDGDDSSLSVINPKVVKQLKDTVSIFTALKELSSNPLQKTIEETVGGMAAGVVQKAFSPPSQHQEKDIIDRILNSQFAAGLGAGLGQRGPELVDTFTKNFGKDKVDGWISGAVRGGSGTGMMGGMGSGIGSGIPGMGSIGGQPKQQSEIEMILGLDPNNPEHVAAYAKSQGDLTVGTARKVLMIHQDDFIDQLKKKGVDTSPYETRRHQEINQSQNQEMSNQYQEAPNQNQEAPNQNQYQEYRRPPPRVNEDLIVNTPATEDKRWEKENENVDNVETQNVDLHPEMERVEPNDKTESPGIVDDEIINYLKSLKDMVEKQGNEMSSLRQELNIIKLERDRVMPEGIVEVNNSKVLSEGRDDNQTTVRSIKTIKKGFRYIKDDKVEG